MNLPQILIDYNHTEEKREIAGNGFHLVKQLPSLFPKVTRDPTTSRRYRFLKRGFDIIFSLVVILVVLTWLVPLLSIAIMLDSKGSPFFVQKRVGKDNRIFHCLKFRTMTVVHNGSPQKVSRLGQFLRINKIDESLQVFNVLRGDMSVVGPRPHMIEDHLAFSDSLDGNFHQRHKVLPGITGLAQVTGYAGPITSRTKLTGRVKMDLFYIQNWTLRLDLWIIWRTVIFLFKPSGKF